MYTPKKPNFIIATIPLLSLIFMAFMSTVYWGIGMLVPIIVAIAVAATIGKMLGYTWHDLEQSLADGVSKALPAGVNPWKWTHQCVLSGGNVHHKCVIDLEVNRCSITQTRMSPPRVVSNQP